MTESANASPTTLISFNSGISRYVDPDTGHELGTVCTFHCTDGEGGEINVAVAPATAEAMRDSLDAAVQMVDQPNPVPELGEPTFMDSLGDFVRGLELAPSDLSNLDQADAAIGTVAAASGLPAHFDADTAHGIVWTTTVTLHLHELGLDPAAILLVMTNFANLRTR